MPRKSTSPQPRVARHLADLGERLKLARLRRGYSMALVAKRAGMSRTTLTSIEAGKPSVTIGAVANVLHALGLEGDLVTLASDDELGQKLQDLGLRPRRRARRKSAGPDGEST